MVAKETAKTSHINRPTPKKQIPFRFVPSLVGGRQTEFVEYDASVPVVGGGTTIVPLTVNGTTDTPQKGCFNEPLGYHIKTLAQMFWEEEAKVDGLLASIDQLTTENLMLGREIEKLTNQLAEAKRQNNVRKDK